MSIKAVGGNPPVLPVNQTRPVSSVDRAPYERQPLLKQQAGEKQREETVQEKETATYPVNDKQLETAVDGLNDLLQVTYTQLQFVFHEKSGEYVVKVKDIATDEVIREIPPEKFLDIIAGLKEYMGLLIDKKV